LQNKIIIYLYVLIWCILLMVYKFVTASNLYLFDSPTLFVHHLISLYSEISWYHTEEDVFIENFLTYVKCEGTLSCLKTLEWSEWCM
jgi:hypothetical protein